MLYSITRINGGVIAWTDEQVAYIVDKYVNCNYTLKQLGREFSCSYGTIRNLLNKQGINSRGNKQGYPRNELYFHSINTPEKAYWLGFMCADGCVHSQRNEISLNITDLEHLEKFKAAIGAINHKITITQDQRFPKAKKLYQLSIKDAQLWKDLNKWRREPQKTSKINRIPNIPKDYVSHFLRGYFDGDGSLHYLASTNNYRISFLGNKPFLEEVRNILNVPKISIAQDRDKNIYQLQISGRKQVVRILNYLYQDSDSKMRLNRKYNKYLECLKWALHH